VIRVPTTLLGSPDSGPDELRSQTVPARKHCTYHVVVFIAVTHTILKSLKPAPTLARKHIPCVRPAQTTPCAAEQRWAEEERHRPTRANCRGHYGHRQERDGAAAAAVSSAASPCCSASSRSSSTCVGTACACGVEGPVDGGNDGTSSSSSPRTRSRWCGCGRRAGGTAAEVLSLTWHA